MSALTSRDRRLQSPVADDPAYSADDDSTIDEMVAEPDCFDNWLSGRPCPMSVTALLSLILDRGLPRKSKSERDDILCDRYGDLIDSVRADFKAWAQHPARGKAAPVDQWREGK